MCNHDRIQVIDFEYSIRCSDCEQLWERDGADNRYTRMMVV